jgi:hypothetical protein
MKILHRSGIDPHPGAPGRPADSSCGHRRSAWATLSRRRDRRCGAPLDGERQRSSSSPNCPVPRSFDGCRGVGDEGGACVIAQRHQRRPGDRAGSAWRIAGREGRDRRVRTTASPAISVAATRNLTGSARWPRRSSVRDTDDRRAPIAAARLGGNQPVPPVAPCRRSYRSEAPSCFAVLRGAARPRRSWRRAGDGEVRDLVV